VGVARIDCGVQRLLKASKHNQTGWCLKRAEGSPHYKGEYKTGDGKWEVEIFGEQEAQIQTKGSSAVLGVKRNFIFLR